MTANSVVNIVTPGIFTSDAQIMFSPIVFFSFYSESTRWYWAMFGFRFILFVLMLFLAIFCLLFWWSCILPFVHEWYSGLALSGTGEVHVVQTNEMIGCSQEMLPTCSKINPMGLVFYSSRVSTGEILTASGDPSLEVQAVAQPHLHPWSQNPTSLQQGCVSIAGSVASPDLMLN